VAPGAGSPLRSPAWHERYKPAASRRTQLLAAALLWTAVGVGLATYGGVRTLRGAGGLGVILFPAAIVAGAAKGRWVLARSARRNLQRILERGEGRCLFGFLSLRSWALVAFMVLLGRTLRHHAATAPIVGPVYLAVGVALLVGSLEIWRAHRALQSTGRVD